MKNMDNNQQTVLITGASSGIGLELAKLFAKDHYNMVIVARNEQQLHETALQLKNEGAGEVTVIAKDLSIPGSADELYNETVARNLHIDVLVNNAGAGVYGLFTETSIADEINIVMLNVVSMLQLTKLYLSNMQLLNRGKILQLASISSYQPTPKLSVYAATKAFILNFSDALHYELKSTDVSVTSLIPGPTATGFFRRAGMEHTRAANEDPEDPAVVAKAGYEALMKKQAHALAPKVRNQILMSTLNTNENVAAKASQQMEPVALA